MLELFAQVQSLFTKLFTGTVDKFFSIDPAPGKMQARVAECIAVLQYGKQNLMWMSRNNRIGRLDSILPHVVLHAKFTLKRFDGRRQRQEMLRYFIATS